MLLETVNIPISKLDTNTGQIEGVPANPRLIKDGKFRKLMQSIKDDPDMLSLRELIVFPLKKRFVVLGGNMRLKACTELGYKDIPCKVLHPKVTPAQMRAIVQKDNIGYGEFDWDMIHNEWDLDELEHWGMDVPKDWGSDDQGEHELNIPQITLTLQFDETAYYQDIKSKIEDILSDFEGVKIKE